MRRIDCFSILLVQNLAMKLDESYRSAPHIETDDEESLFLGALKSQNVSCIKRWCMAALHQGVLVGLR